jgi:hypothetical protein
VLLRLPGFLLEAAGLGLVVVSRLALGRSFTVLPRPRDRSTLRRTGIYARARHPVYGGLLVACAGRVAQRVREPDSAGADAPRDLMNAPAGGVQIVRSATRA